MKISNLTVIKRLFHFETMLGSGNIIEGVPCDGIR